jgi:hypothetical protein
MVRARTFAILAAGARRETLCIAPLAAGCASWQTISGIVTML